MEMIWASVPRFPVKKVWRGAKQSYLEDLCFFFFNVECVEMYVYGVRFSHQLLSYFLKEKEK